MTATLFVQGVACWPAHGVEHDADPPARLLPPRTRGRASKLTAAIVEVGEQAAHAAELDPAALPWLIGSAYGEIETTVQLLRMMATGDAALSPARFQASVHNTAAGVLSIATGNSGFSTSLAAGPATTSAILLEACGIAQLEAALLVVVADEPLPAPFGAARPADPAVAVAFALARAADARSLARITIVAAAEPDPYPLPTEPHAFEPALELAHAVRAAEPTRLRLPAAHGYGMLVDVAPERVRA
jgi:hypothetical protein